jgi:RIO kinase 1
MLKSGKEAEVYLVEAGGVERVAKVYKEAHVRSFKQRADYTEGRNLRNSRDRRAIGKRSRHGRAKDEEEWRTAEVEVIYKLRHAGVRVPAPYNFMDGVLVMDLVRDERGRPAPRLADVDLAPEAGELVFEQLLRETIKMLCAGVVHGDLSDFNVLLGAEGPVIIDFPQAVDPARNNSARRLLLRDVDNLHDFLARTGGRGRRKPYGPEIWSLYERSELTPDTKLSGRHVQSRGKANVQDVVDLIAEAKPRQAGGRGQRGAAGMKVVSPMASPKSSRVVEVVMTPTSSPSKKRPSGRKRRGGQANAASRSGPSSSHDSGQGSSPKQGTAGSKPGRSGAGRRRRRRRGGKPQG